jgi:hypothetical protein
MTLFVRNIRGANPPAVLPHEGAGSSTLWERFLLRLPCPSEHADLPDWCSPVTLASTGQQQRN